jgi:hypothetical protein
MHKSPYLISKMQDLSEYINNKLAEESATLSIEDHAGASHDWVEGERTLSHTSKPTLLPVLLSLEQPPRITGQSFAVPNVERSWTPHSSILSHSSDFSRVLSIGSRLVKAKTKKGRLNIKKNLTLEEIDPAASGLITDDSIPFFLNNFDLIYDVWIFFMSTRAKARSAEDSVVAAFDIFYCLIGVRDAKLLLRFAYVQLAEAIEALVKKASTERRNGHVHQGSSYRDESVYIDVYLAAKGKPLNDKKLRNELSGRKRIAVRLRQLVYPAPLLLAVYSDDAESIMYVLLSIDLTKLIPRSHNTSIGLPTLESLVIKVEQACPDLVRILADLVKEGDRAIKSNERPNVSTMRNAFAQTATELLGLVARQ